MKTLELYSVAGGAPKTNPNPCTALPMATHSPEIDMIRGVMQPNVSLRSSCTRETAPVCQVSSLWLRRFGRSAEGLETPPNIVAAETDSVRLRIE